MIKAKKSLGQNFLKSRAVLEQVVQAASVAVGDVVLEIGPGKGALTEEILATGAKVIAVEKDDRLIALLEEKFINSIKKKKLQIINGDILELDLKKLKLKNGNFKLVANIPYYITGLILRRFLEEGPRPNTMSLIVQKEVAERIVARDGKESILSVSVKVFGQPKIIRTVAKGFFQPVPKVDSAILAIENISDNFFKDFSSSSFFQILKKGFGQKRKILRGNLKCPATVLDRCNIPQNIRAEDMSLGEWHCLVKALNPKTQNKIQ